MAQAGADWLQFRDSSFDEASFSWAWLWALATYGVGDVVTTIAIIWFHPMYTEANPVVREAIMAFGGGGFLALKLLVFYVCIGVSLWGGLLGDDPLLFYGPPLALGVVGLFTTALNLGLLF